MKYFNWNPKLSRSLEAQHGFSIEDVVFHIDKGGLRDVLVNADDAVFGKLRALVVAVGNRTCVVPFLETDTEVSIQNVIPSDWAGRRYREKGDGKGKQKG